MNRRVSVIAFVSLALAACSTDTILPVKTPPPSVSLDKSSGSWKGQFLVLMKGESIDLGFDGRVKSLGGEVRRRHDAAGFAAVSGLTDVTAAQLATAPGVSEVVPDVQISLNLPIAPVEADAAGVGATTAPPPIDPTTAILYSWQWNMRAIKANEAWAAGKVGSPNVTVAIIDTGLDYDAFDLNGLVDRSRSHSFMNVFIPATDTSPVRPSDDSVTKNFFPSRDSVTDYNGHGTNVATQVSSNAFAFAGVTAKTTLIGVKVLGSNGVGSLGTVLSGVIWAADHDADVANMSLGGDFPRSGNRDIINIINRVFDYAKKKRMLIVVAAGNAAEDLDHNGDTFSTYCDAPHVLCVSAVGPIVATGNPDLPAFYTNFGRRSIDVAAPGGNLGPLPNGTKSNWPWGPDVISWVWSLCSKTLIGGWTAANAPRLTTCTFGNRLYAAIGTSQASPHAAGLAALLVSVTGKSKPDQIKKMIEESADDLGPRGRDAFFGEGRINVAAALQRGRDGHHDDWDPRNSGPR
jgi:subtilisin family serine protease